METIVRYLRAAGPLNHLKAVGPLNHLRAVGPLNHLKAAGPLNHLRAAGPLNHLRAAGPLNSPKGGQIVLVLAFMVLGLLFLVLVNADVFLAIRGKGRLQNAGDAAALAAARWQGITLNALGALNLAQIDIACKYADAPATATNRSEEHTSELQSH